ncbi:MAG: cobalamin-binding protein [Candidatus Hydrogenedens sp.]|jgi:methanogenic corrinoid protein MtbC1|nr:cobalamin-binding protein [Candidatus Hydrogenedens sp.]
MELMEKIADLVIRGKVNQSSAWPPDLKGKDGVFELVRDALAAEVDPNEILSKGLKEGMEIIGQRFSIGEAYVPDLLMAAKAMTAGMDQLQPFFESGAATRRGVFVVGTVLGDNHDIGKNLVRMMMEGAGFEVIDLGYNVAPEAFLAAVKEHPGCLVGLSALLTSTMINMKQTTQMIKDYSPDTLVAVGGAPLTQGFCDSIGADIYAEDPQKLIEWLNEEKICC